MSYKSFIIELHATKNVKSGSRDENEIGVHIE
jgi:hypothetical protein